MNASPAEERPVYPLDDPDARQRFNHHIEWEPGWEYRSTFAVEAEHPDGWDYMATQPAGWELNVDKWPLVDEAMKGRVRVAPGVIRNPETGHLRAYWRRPVPPP